MAESSFEAVTLIISDRPVDGNKNLSKIQTPAVLQLRTGGNAEKTV